MQHYQTQFSNAMPAKADIVTKLNIYGYDISKAGTESGYKDFDPRL